MQVLFDIRHSHRYREIIYSCVETLPLIILFKTSQQISWNNLSKKIWTMLERNTFDWLYLKLSLIINHYQCFERILNIWIFVSQHHISCHFLLKPVACMHRFQKSNAGICQELRYNTKRLIMTTGVLLPNLLTNFMQVKVNKYIINHVNWHRLK